MLMQKFALYEKIGRLKARYFGYAAMGLLFVFMLGLSDYGILYNIEHGYTDISAMKDLHFPIYTVDDNVLVGNIELAAIAGLLGFAIFILIARAKSGEDPLA